MSMKQTFYRSVAVIGLASLLGAAPAQLNAQSTVAINNDDWVPQPDWESSPEYDGLRAGLMSTNHARPP
jgi:hypothetical protein